LVLVIGIAIQWKELVEVAACNVRPSFAIGRNGELRPAGFLFKMSADEGAEENWPEPEWSVAR